jgi:phage terminase small subunit
MAPKKKIRLSKSTQAKLDALSPRKKKYAAGRLSGKSKAQAALEAGFSPAMANTPSKIETPDVTDAMRSLLDEMIPLEHLALRIKEGTNAMKTEFAKHNGKIKDEVDTIDHAQRHNFVKLALSIKGVKGVAPVTSEDGDGSKRVTVIIDC